MVLAAVLAAIWAAAVGSIAITCVVLLSWTAERNSGAAAGATLRIAADLWLLANGSSLRVSGSPFALIPLGLTALPACLLLRAGTSLARAVGVMDLRGVLGPTSALAGAYGGLAVVATGAAATPQVQVAPLRAFLAAAGLATVCGGLGVIRGAGLCEQMWARIPASVRAALHGGAVAAIVVLAGGAGLAGCALALSSDEAGQVLSGLGVGAVGALGLLLLSLAYLPNAVVCAAAFVMGAGFAVGAGTVVSPFGVRLGPVPALPLFAALPGGPVTGWLALLIAVPMIGGAIAGAGIGRQQRAAPLRRSLSTAAATGPAAGALLGLLSLLSAGPAGAGRLATVGPSAWRVALMLAVEVGSVAVAAAWWTARRSGSDPQRGERRPRQVAQDGEGQPENETEPQDARRGPPSGQPPPVAQAPLGPVEPDPHHDRHHDQGDDVVPRG